MSEQKKLTIQKSDTPHRDVATDSPFVLIDNTILVNLNEVSTIAINGKSLEIFYPNGAINHHDLSDSSEIKCIPINES